MLKPKQFKSKYKNQLAQIGSTIYDSKKEARYAEQLHLRKLAGEIIEIIPQYCLRLDVNGEHICKYYMDFKLIMSDGSIEYHEVKGFETDVWRIKWKLAKALINDGKFVLIK
jgi:hypothetical protein